MEVKYGEVGYRLIEILDLVRALTDAIYNLSDGPRFPKINISSYLSPIYEAVSNLKSPLTTGVLETLKPVLLNRRLEELSRLRDKRLPSVEVISLTRDSGKVEELEILLLDVEISRIRLTEILSDRLSAERHDWRREWRLWDDIAELLRINIEASRHAEPDLWRQGKVSPRRAADAPLADKPKQSDEKGEVRAAVDAKLKLTELLALPVETEWLEFKEAKNSFDFEKLGQYFSALSNEANLKGQPWGWLVFGITNKVPRQIVGTQFKLQRPALDELKKRIADQTTNRLTFEEIHEILLPEGRVLLFQIPPALRAIPTGFKGHFYGRDNESLGPLGLHEIERIRSQ
ncbi:MAG: ATP-binding protein [Thermoguttaceae bacterium]